MIIYLTGCVIALGFCWGLWDEEMSKELHGRFFECSIIVALSSWVGVIAFIIGQAKKKEKK